MIGQSAFKIIIRLFYLRKLKCMILIEQQEVIAKLKKDFAVGRVCHAPPMKRNFIRHFEFGRVR
jgi:hypothetical protein